MSPSGRALRLTSLMGSAGCADPPGRRPALAGRYRRYCWSATGQRFATWALDNPVPGFSLLPAPSRRKRKLDLLADLPGAEAAGTALDFAVERRSWLASNSASRTARSSPRSRPGHASRRLRRRTVRCLDRRVPGSAFACSNSSPSVPVPTRWNSAALAGPPPTSTTWGMKPMPSSWPTSRSHVTERHAPCPRAAVRSRGTTRLPVRASSGRLRLLADRAAAKPLLGTSERVPPARSSPGRGR